ncbi:MAG: DUF1343 domain-containing protein [Vicingus serpentipes]|nr:DUF1343 domain-containing protein [Vicingus serpentipes]
MVLKQIINLLFISLFFIQCHAQEKKEEVITVPLAKKKEVLEPIRVGAEELEEYIPLIQGKKVGIVANHTSLIDQTHLVDSLIHLGVNVVRVFSPEHGFRGDADAGEHVQSNTDEKTGLPLTSLYGKNKKPLPEQVKNLDVIVFDIQDVGARFYTYVSTMHYVMEACAENNIDFIVLDRPNPNGHYVDGPVLEKAFQSFVGMHPVPIVHGMTVGEYAQMVNGEGWLKNGVKCNLSVVKSKNYTHQRMYQLPIKPSPNLPNMSSVYLYPSLCLFEGTPISVGRGTDKPFQIIGHPAISSNRYSFTPKSKEGAKNPKLMNEQCNGYDLSMYGEVYMKDVKKINLFWLINLYQEFPDKEQFFNSSFNRLAGNSTLQEQIRAGKTEEEIKATWEEDLRQFKLLRKKYLLYPDFE